MDAGELAERFGLGAAPRLTGGPVARGKQGVVWRLETRDGRWAVKVPFRPSTEDEVSRSARFQEAAVAAGVPAPSVVRTTDGQLLADVGGGQVRLYTWVDLLPPDPLLDPEQVGAAVAALHQVPFAVEGGHEPWHTAPVGAGRWDTLVEQLRRAGAPFAGRLAELRNELVELESWIEPAEVARTCHRDLWADNLLPTPDGGLCVIDWDDCGPADPSQELACVLFEFGRTDPGRAHALAASYTRAGGPARVTRRGHFSMLIAQLGNITATAAADWLEPNPRSPRRADSAAWISETFDEPHTREVLEALLRAAGPWDAPAAR